ncbi:hypothetical protein FBALC1_13757 [Flavobacteriales bacterium ALC-1]|nr:hypothetical protein FBALC1_13757 [Flavobacteriales bacterium ALC-1]
MKLKLKLPLILLVLVFLYSCETEEIQEQSSTIESIKKKDSDIYKKDPNVRAEIDLENRMQWISYMTAQTLLRDDDARQQFENEVVNSGTYNAFHIKALLKENVQNASFKNEFRDVFYLYYNEEDLCDTGGRPRGGPTPPSPIGGIPPGTIPPSPFELYIDSILHDDCFEFYLPNGYNPLVAVGGGSGGQIVLKSTAHPLNDDAHNDGYYHNGSYCYNASEISINNNTFGIIIMVRPLRVTIGNCTYDDYSVNNFEDFLD